MLAWLIMLQALAVVTAVQCSAVYSLNTTCNVTYGTVLTRYENVKNIVRCASWCNTNTLCNSLVYSRSSRICSTNSQKLVTSQTNCGSDITYAEAREKKCTSGLNSPTSAPLSITTATASVDITTTATTDSSTMVTEATTLSNPLPTGSTISTSVSSTTATSPATSSTSMALSTSTSTTLTSTASATSTSPVHTTSEPTASTTSTSTASTTSTSPISSTSTAALAMTETTTTVESSTATLATTLFSAQFPSTTNLTADAFCSNGDRYDPASSACVQDCSGSYGSTFQYDPQKKPDFPPNACNDDWAFIPPTPELCREMCLAETSFVCKTFTVLYDGDWSECMITDCTLVNKQEGQPRRSAIQTRPSTCGTGTVCSMEN